MTTRRRVSGGRWGVAYTHTRDPRHAEEDLRTIARAGARFVIHPFSETDWRFHQHAMRRIMAISRRLGLTVWVDPWGVGGVFGGETLTVFPVEHPQARQVSSDGQWLPAACLNHPAFHRWMRGWLRAAAALKPHGIFWDEPHWRLAPPLRTGLAHARRWSCRCEACGRLFRRTYRQALSGRWSSAVAQWRQHSVVRLLGQLTGWARRRRLRNTVCLYPLEGMQAVVDWVAIAGLPAVDVISTDPYWRVFHRPVEPFVRHWSERMLQLARATRKEAQIWIQLFGLPRGREQEAALAVRAARQAGIRNIALWSFEAGALVDHLRSDRPQLVWRRAVAALR